MKKKCSSKHNLQLSFKYLVKLLLILKLLSKVSLMHTTISRGTPNPLGGNKGCKVCNVCGQ